MNAAAFLPVWNSRSLIVEGEAPSAAAPQAIRNPRRAAQQHRADSLGRFRDSEVFAYEFEALEPPQLEAGTRWEDLRLLAPILPAEDAGLLGYARGMVSCVPGTVLRHVRRTHPGCQRRACSDMHEPGMPPRAIPAHRSGHHRLVSDGERALLGRQAAMARSALFHHCRFCRTRGILEDAVAREVFEETGIDVDRIPISFFAALALSLFTDAGIHGHALTTQIQRRDDELEDAQWFTREDLTSGRPIVRRTCRFPSA